MSSSSNISPAFSACATKPKSKRPAPLSLRLSAWERAKLEKQADGLPLGSYIKGQLFSGKACKKTSAQDYEELAKILGMLASLNVFGDVAALLKGLEAGTLHIEDDMEDALVTACKDITTMRLLLVHALGVKAV